MSGCMFLAGIPIAWILYSDFLPEFGASPLLSMRILGGLIWFFWLVRALWAKPPRGAVITLWVVSFAYHLQYLAFSIVAVFHPFFLYLVGHTLIMVILSAMLLRRDRP